MTLIPGARLGPYEIVSTLGEGGMGQVFRARDAKLNRDVALKVLPEAFAADADRLARFTREAQVLASLNHPNIAQIYGIESDALVMELVEGEDLSTIIARGPVSLSDALPIAQQIAEALAAAHEQGIIHRDLKPANIKVRADGMVKVLDFGLAKAMDPPSSSARQALSQFPTLTSPAMTAMGMILGTAAYMSPEQARGKTVDRRADIWAFGAVLYEMLTGKRAFDADDISLTMARVLEREPDFDALPSAVPARIRQALRVCLRKDPKQRASDIRDVQLALDGAFETPSIITPSITTPDLKVGPTRALPWAASAAALVFAIAWLIAWAPWRAETPVDRPLVRLDVDLGADVSLPPSLGTGSAIAITPDGTRLIYASGSPTKLLTRRLDQAKATELPGTEGASIVFVSPDSLWVGFASRRALNKISVEGGAIVSLAAEASVAGAAKWGDDGSLFTPVLGRKLTRIPAGGGPPETVAEARNGELGVASPEPLPGGTAILVAADNPGPVDKTTIDVVTLATRERKTVIHGGASPRYLATADGLGHLVYVSQTTLFAIPFDLRTLETRGTAVPVLDDVASERTIGTGQFDVSRTGTLVYRRATGGASALRVLKWVDATGKKAPFGGRLGVYEDVSLSPDGKRVALTVIDGASQGIWIYDAQRDAMTRLTFDAAAYRAPTWSPDGRYVLFSSVGNGIFQARVDGASRPQALLENKIVQYPRSFSPDGKWLAYHQNAGGGAGELWTVPISEEGGHLKAGRAESFLKSTAVDRLPVFSPDGRWLAYESSELGETEVFVRAFPPTASGAGGQWQISTSGGTAPRWSPGGHDLLYQSGDSIMAASYTTKGAAFVADKPRVWIANVGAVLPGIGSSTWDVARDGKSVVVVTPAQSVDASTREHHVVFLLNFFDELRRRVPLGK